MPRKKASDDPLLKEIETLIPHRHAKGRQSHLSLDTLRRIRDYARRGMFEKRIYGVLGIPRPTWDAWKKKGRVLLEAYENGDKSLDSLDRHQLCCLYMAYTIRTGMPEAIMKVEENLRLLAETRDYKNIRAIELYLRTRDRDNYGRQVFEHHHVQEEPEMTPEREAALDKMLGDIFEYNGHEEE